MRTDEQAIKITYGLQGKTIGVNPRELKDNIFIDTNYRADELRKYTIKKGEHKGKRLYLSRIRRIQP